MIIGKLTPTSSVTGKLISGSGTPDHSKLTNRDLDNQHPITAITGLDVKLNQQDQQISGQKQDLARVEATLTTKLQAELERAKVAEANIVASIPETVTLDEFNRVLAEVFDNNG